MANQLALSFLRGLGELGCYNWSDIGGGGAVATTYFPYPGAAGVKCTGLNAAYNFYDARGVALPAELSELYLGFIFSLEAVPDSIDNAIFGCYDSGGNMQVGFKVNPSGVVQVYTGDFATLRLSSPLSVSFGASKFYRIDARIKIDDSAGMLELYVDGDLQGTFSGDTKSGAGTGVKTLRFGAGRNQVARFYNLVVNDPSGTENNGLPGPWRFVLLNPTADAGPNAWTASGGGSHCAEVDEDTPASADKLTTLVTAQQEVFNLEDLPVEAYKVKLAAVEFVGLKSGDTAPNGIRLGLDIGGTQYLSGVLACPTSQGYVRHNLELNPAGGALNPTVVNGAKFVMESTDTGA